jgi:hypothetical protein
MRDPREYLIRKNGYFYRPNRSGYTMEKVVAGRYTKAEADREAAIEPENFTVLHESEVPDAPEVVDLKASNADLQAEILSLRQQVEKARAQGRDEGLEEAAKVCAGYVTPYGRAGSSPTFEEVAARNLAAAILALKSGEGGS